jgi:regulator of sigma E protease
MNEWLANILALVVVLGILITVHEWGHFATARFFGVKVLRFSVGFGKPLWTRQGRDGTEYVVAAIPLGGYVKMLDEREAPVPEADLARAFNRKPVGQRFAIVAAGPLINLAFAVLAYWVLYMTGVTQMAAVVGSVDEGSAAAVAGIRAGDEVVAVDGTPVRSWDDVALRLVRRAGETGTVELGVQSPGAMQPALLALGVDDFLDNNERRTPAAVLGMHIYLPPAPPVIGTVVADTPAAAAGLERGDRVVAIDGEPLADWQDLVEVVRASPGRELHLEIERAGERQSLQVTPALHDDKGEAVGRIGAAPQLRWPQDWPEEQVRHLRFGPVDAMARALHETRERIVLTLDAVRKMITGALSVETLGGPITIAREAGATASFGPEAFVGFLAFLSISIGILNLLPIPVLDGGHLVFYAVEAVRGRPVPERVQLVLLQVGVWVLASIMLIAVYNDIMRLGAP